uniref:Uncharacterized protein n=2 Tax=Chrysotila carterae TaxID=13221 RepID=A0A7S4BQZ5_CHRCT
MLCSCELGFWIKHVEEDCRAGGHHTLQLPYLCPVDHYLFPRTLARSRFAHRERSFLENPRTPESARRSMTVDVCRGSGCDAESVGDGQLLLAASPTAASIRRRLGHLNVSILHFSDVLGSFGGFESKMRTARFHSEAQELLSGWCCTSHPAFKKLGGEVPYLLPPLPGQREWRGTPKLAWAANTIAQLFREANQSTVADELEPCATSRSGRTGEGCA